MDFDNIKIGLSRVQSLVGGWESAGVEELERDLALDELRRIYSEIRFGEGMAKEQPEAEAETEAETETVVVPPVAAEEPAPEVDADEASDEPEIEIEIIMPDEDEQDGESDDDAAEDDAVEEQEQPAADGTTDEVPAVEDAAQTTEEPAAEEPAAAQQPAEELAESGKAEEVPEPTASEAEPQHSEAEVQPTEQEEPTAAETEQPEDEPVVAEVATTCDTAETHGENRNSEQSLFGDDEIVLTRASRRRVIMSLYDDDMPAVVSDRKPEPEPKSEPVQEQPSEAGETVEPESAAEAAEKPFAEKPVAEKTVEESAEAPVAIPEIEDDMVLGDVLRADVHTLGESIARPKGLAESAPVASLRAAIGINDRFLLIRDLFDGDAAAYEKAIVAIDAFDNLDDCMVHIVENYSWRSSSDGAKLIMDLIQRKYRK